MKKTKYNKYVISHKIFVVNIILVIIFFVVFLFFLLFTNSDFFSSIDAEIRATSIILKEASLVGLTIFASSIISSSILERTSKNNEYFTDTLNEFVCDPRILGALNDTNRKYLKASLLDLKHTSQVDMMESIITKLKEFDYYYEECSLEVSCTICQDRCEKKFTKKLKVRSFDDSFEIPNYRLYSSVTKETNNDFLTIKWIKIDGKALSKKADYLIKKEPIKSEEKMSLKKGYNIRFICELVHPLKLSSDKPVSIVLEYETSVSNDDCFINRLPGPCKKYHLSFEIINSKKVSYDISGSAFGFMDRGDRIPNIGDNRLVIDFDSWSFKDDGVSLYYKKKK